MGTPAKLKLAAEILAEVENGQRGHQCEPYSRCNVLAVFKAFPVDLSRYRVVPVETEVAESKPRRREGNPEEKETNPPSGVVTERLFGTRIWRGAYTLTASWSGRSIEVRFVEPGNSVPQTKEGKDCGAVIDH